MTPWQHYEAGRLTEAIRAATDEVKSSPADVSKRVFLCELLCFAGDIDRADVQFETIGRQRAESALGVVLFRQLVRAEKSRQEFFSGGRLPEFVAEPTNSMRLALEASIAIREDDLTEAAKLLGQADEQRRCISGTSDGEAFDDVRDLDDLTASFVEVLTSNGKYYWIPLEQIQAIEFHKPQRPLDLLWLRVSMDVRDGPSGEVFLPTIYAGTDTQGDDQLRLGRATDWRGGEGEPVRGIGQRVFLVGSNEQPILQLQHVEIANPAV